MDDRPAAAARGPVLASKITPPGVPGWAVPRPRISELITGGVRRCPLTVVTGPAGAGKTMTLALWAAAEARPAAWVGLDKYDNRPGVFWTYVIAALRQSGAAVPNAPPAARGRASDHVFVLCLASALAAQDRPATLILDDLHLLADPKVLGELDYLLRNANCGLRLVVASRMDPLLPLHRYRLAGQLAEIRAGDLAFSTAEAGLVLAQHGITLPAGSLQCLTQRTEGWAAGIRLAALSMRTHPDPGQFARDLAADDSAVTGYLVQEVLNAQPPKARDILLSTSILERVSADAARELTGHDQAGQILPALARANAFVQPAGGGWYRYHPLFAEVLRLKLRREHPGRVASLHRRAARWHERNGRLADAVRHAVQAGDWPLAARIVVDGLAIGEIIEPQDRQPLADQFRKMPRGAWAEPAPHLVLAAAALSAGQPESSAAALEAAEGILDHRPAGQEAPARLAAAMIRLTTARRTGDLTAAASAVDRAEALAETAGRDILARHPEARARVLFGRGVVELWSGHLDQACQVLESGAAVPGGGRGRERADCLGYLALVEVLRGRPGRAAQLAAEAASVLAPGERTPPAGHPGPGSLVALAWVRLNRGEVSEARRLLKQAGTALGAAPDQLIGAIACLVTAHCALAEGRAGAAAQIVIQARSERPVPAWLGQRLSLAESWAFTAAGDIGAALAAAGRAGGVDSPEAAVTLARAWAAAGDGASARRALEPVLAARNSAPELLRLQAWLVDARVSYDRGDHPRGRRCLAAALRLAGQEQLRLPIALERSWIEPALRRDPGLASAYQRLLGLAVRHGHLPASSATPVHPPVPPVVEPLSEREREVLRHLSGLLSAAEIAGEMHISLNTVKTHLKNSYRKLAATGRGDAVRRARQLELI